MTLENSNPLRTVFVLLCLFAGTIAADPVAIGYIDAKLVDASVSVLF